MSENKPFEEVTVKVNGITGGAYSRGIFSFTYNGQQVDAGQKGISTKYNYKHHLEMDDIVKLNRQYPDQIPLFNKKIYRTWTNWGYRVEEGLCDLMIQRKFFIDENKNGHRRIWFEWEGPPWQR